jgi:diphosphomevalonate decarboxylase
MKATAIAPSNIAFIKYWGKLDEELRIPANDSLSMNISAAVTTTTVEFLPKHKSDDIKLMDGTFTKAEKDRIIKHLNRIRQKAGIFEKAKVVTKNSFPKGTGIASSASGFAALTVAGCQAAGLVLTKKELTMRMDLCCGKPDRHQKPHTPAVCSPPITGISAIYWSSLKPKKKQSGVLAA